MARRVLIHEVLPALAARSPAPAEGKGFPAGRFHNFRHSFCSICANSGTPREMLMRWLGHRHSAMVQHYDHLHDDVAR